MRRLFLVLALCAFSGLSAIAQPPSASQKKPVAAEPTFGAEAPEHAAGPTETHATSVKEGKEGSEDAEEKMKRSPSVQWLGRKLGISVQNAYWVSVLLNFAVVAVFIGMLLRSKLPAAFRERSGSIQRQMEEARRASADATTRLKDIESRLARLDVQITEMRTTAEREAAAEEERLRAAAETERRKIVESTAQEIGAISGNARRELKHFAAELAVNVAAQRIKVDDSTDRTLVHDFAAHLNDGAKGGA